MIQREQIYQDISNLPEEAQNLLVDFIEFLKHRYLSTEKPIPKNLEFTAVENNVEKAGKLIDIMQFSDVINWDVDGLEYQKSLRSEWK